jgi:hypothetical protein
MKVSEAFRNYIIKKVIKGISLNASTLKYDYRVELPDAVFDEIKNEGATRYALLPEDVVDIVSDVSRDIRFEPLKADWSNSINPLEIRTGQHFIIHTSDRTYGENKLELICLGENKFLALYSDRNDGLHRGDMLKSVNTPWHPNHIIDFEVDRQENRFPDENHYYRTHLIHHFEYLNPPPIFQIYDSDTDYTNGSNAEATSTEEETADSQNLRTGIPYYTWCHTVIKPTAFVIDFNDSTAKDKSAPFLITVYDDGIASFKINELHRLTENIVELAFFRIQLEKACDFLTECENLNSVRNIITVEEGKLVRTTDPETRKSRWEIAKKAKIKFILKKSL